MRKWIFILAVTVGAVITYKYLYKDHRDIASEKVTTLISAQYLYREFLKDPTSSQSSYLNKTITISGNISSISEKSITVDKKVFCQFADPIANTATIGNQISVKGRLIGFDELLEEIKLDQCTIIN